jgi:hypothetical protein
MRIGIEKDGIKRPRLVVKLRARQRLRNWGWKTPGFKVDPGRLNPGL